MPATDHGGGALDVVVEARDPVAVAVEQPDRVVLLEVLPLQEGVGVDLGPRFDERVDERVVGFAPQAGAGVAQVLGVAQQLLVVGAAVEGDRKGQARVDARPRGVEGELADGDAHAPGSLVAEAEDALVVGDDDQPDVPGARCCAAVRGCGRRRRA